LVNFTTTTMNTEKSMRAKSHLAHNQITIDENIDYDVVIVGGAFSGSSSALLLKREFPDLRVLVIEKSQEFDRPQKLGLHFKLALLHFNSTE